MKPEWQMKLGTDAPGTGLNRHWSDTWLDPRPAEPHHQPRTNQDACVGVLSYRAYCRAFRLERQRSKSPERKAMLSGVRILVAEDECVIALDLTNTFERAGAAVIGPATTVREALRLARSEPLDRALLDFNLADGEVTPVLELLASKGVPVVIYTGRGLPPELASQHPDLTVLRKPVSHRQLIGELAAARAKVNPEINAEWDFQACDTEVT